MIEEKSICRECLNYYEDEPEKGYRIPCCELAMQNFGTTEGCYSFKWRSPNIEEGERRYE